MISAVFFEPVAIYFASGLVPPDKLVRSSHLTVWRQIYKLHRCLICTLGFLAHPLTWSGRSRVARWFLRYIFGIKRQHPSIIPTLILGELPFEYRYLIRGPGSPLATFMMTGLLTAIGGFLLAVHQHAPGTAQHDVLFPDSFLIVGLVFVVMIMIMMLRMTTRLRFLETRFPLECSIFAMQLYRFGKVESVFAKYGPRGHAALVLLIPLLMPRGAVQIRTEILKEACDVLGLQWGGKPIEDQSAAETKSGVVGEAATQG
jgi:hypothetical protein